MNDTDTFVDGTEPPDYKPAPPSDGTRVKVIGPEGSSSLGKCGTVESADTAANVYAQVIARERRKRHRGKKLDPAAIIVTVHLDDEFNLVPGEKIPKLRNFHATDLEVID